VYRFPRSSSYPELEPRAAERAEKEQDEEDGKKKKSGGIHVPDEWPWEEAKKVFEKPDVLSGDEIQVIPPLSSYIHFSPSYLPLFSVVAGVEEPRC
jgi:hypothetical protein